MWHHLSSLRLLAYLSLSVIVAAVVLAPLLTDGQRTHTDQSHVAGPGLVPSSNADKETEKNGTVAALPSFDVVRVEPNGDAVLAGRAAPGSTVTVLRNSAPYADTVADSNGAFALVLPQLPAGASDILLRSVGRDGAAAQSEAGITTVIAQDRTSPPMVARMSPDSATAVLSAGIHPDAARHDGGNQPNAVRIESVDLQAGTRIFVSGRAAPGAIIRLLLNDRWMAEQPAAQDGQVTFDIRNRPRSGNYRIRLEEIDPSGGPPRSHSDAALALPHEVTATAGSQVDHTGAVLIPGNTVVIARGDNLWTISRRVYGQGGRYTLIFGANREAIHDPNKIYPKQVFIIPAS
jgi:nucleoid-associated protein YgaU